MVRALHLNANISIDAYLFMAFQFELKTCDTNKTKWSDALHWHSNRSIQPMNGVNLNEYSVNQCFKRDSMGKFLLHFALFEFLIYVWLFELWSQFIEVNSGIH